MIEVDVIVIGAGIAGIGAALELQERGAHFVVLEGASRVGGRAFTDTQSLPVAWDHGCHWLHSASRNPLVCWADRLKVKYSKQVRENHFTIYTGKRFATPSELGEARQLTSAAFDAIERSANDRIDVSVASVVPDSGRWNRALRSVLQSVLGDDPENISTLGYGDYEDDGEDWPIESGFGDMVAKMARSLPIRLRTPVRKLHQGVNKVVVETISGTLQARAAILTPSTNVLVSDSIDISAGPARDLLDWVADVPCGAYEKVAFALRELPHEVKGKLFCTIDASEVSESAVEFEVVETCPPLLIAHIAGRLARVSSASSPQFLTELARDQLVAAFGVEVESQIIGTGTTNWGGNLFVRGSYSHAKPGTALRRREMLSIDTENVVFAGEAFSLHWESTAHGAYLSGRTAARRLVSAGFI